MDRKTAKRFVSVMIAVLLSVMLGACSPRKAADSKLPVKVLILPKFEVDAMAGDFPGEAQYSFLFP